MNVVITGVLSTTYHSCGHELTMLTDFEQYLTQLNILFQVDSFVPIAMAFGRVE